jgi:hypothetical protein
LICCKVGSVHYHVWLSIAHQVLYSTRGSGWGQDRPAYLGQFRLRPFPPALPRGGWDQAGLYHFRHHIIDPDPPDPPSQPSHVQDNSAYIRSALLSHTSHSCPRCIHHIYYPLPLPLPFILYSMLNHNHGSFHTQSPLLTDHTIPPLPSHPPYIHHAHRYQQQHL